MLSALDWSLAAAVLYVLLPEPRPDFAYFVGAFLAAQLIALVSHVPGGLGVFESLMILMLQACRPTTFCRRWRCSASSTTCCRSPSRWASCSSTSSTSGATTLCQWGNAFGTLTTSVAPKLLAVFMMLGGAVLMFSGATPTAAGRLAWRQRASCRCRCIELSHFVGSLVGFGLLVVAWGLARRLDAAYVLWPSCGLVVGIVASLLKGGDYEEALVLAALLVALVASRDEFDRKAALFDIPFSPAWLIATCAVVARVGRPRAVRVPARRVLERAVVAVRGRSGRAALPARDGRRAGRDARSSALRQLLRPADRPAGCPARRAELDAARAMVAGTAADVGEPRVPRDKALLWNERAHGVPDVRRPGPHVGGARRPGGPGEARPSRS